LLLPVVATWTLVLVDPDTHDAGRTTVAATDGRCYDAWIHRGIGREEWSLHPDPMELLYEDSVGSSHASRSTPRYGPPPNWVAFPGPVGTRDTRAWGWPWLCLASEYELVPPYGSMPMAEKYEFSIAVRPRRKTYQLPTRPLWSGLRAEAGATAAVLAPAWVMALTSIRVVRRWRGSCPACGYDRRGLPADAKCPECGTAPARG
jgi:hypothetical protein